MGMLVIKRDEGAFIISMTGKWMGTNEERDLVKALQKELEVGAIKAIILDLGEMEWSNSYGVGVMAGMFGSAKQLQAKMGLANVPLEIKKLLDISFLSKVMPIYPSVESALNELCDRNS